MLQANPKGIVSSSPGLRACELPWERFGQMWPTPPGLLHRVADSGTTPVGLKARPHRFPREARRLATLGVAAESLWDSAIRMEAPRR